MVILLDEVVVQILQGQGSNKECFRGNFETLHLREEIIGPEESWADALHWSRGAEGTSAVQ